MPAVQPRTIAELLGAHTRLFSLPLSDGVPVGDDPQSTVRWHKIGIEGEWQGHWMGAFSLSRRDFEQAALHQRAKAIKTLVDYEHKSVFAMFTSADSRAAGWADTLDVREAQDGSAELWARIEWTPAAAQAIRGREYSYTSPVFRWHTPDRVSGADLGFSVPSIALTNTPFLHELPEVTLNSWGLLQLPHREVAMFSQSQLTQVLSALNLADGASADDVLKTLAERAKDGKALERICTTLELESGSDAERIVAEVSALRAKASGAADPEELEALRERMNAMEADALIQSATQKGQIVASNREWALKLAKKDPEGFREWAASAPAIVPVGRSKQPPANGTNAIAASGELTAEQLQRCVAGLSERQLHAASQQGVSPETFVKFGLTLADKQALLAG